jgi:hypothetical protein
MIDHTNLIYQQSLSIPEAIRKDIVAVVRRNEGRIHWQQSDLQYVFDVWNRYMTREPEDIGCGGCRTKVVGKLRRIVAIWESKGEA